MMISFFVQCDPVPDGRPRFTTRGGCPRAITPAKVRNMRAVIALQAALYAPPQPLTGPLRLKMGVYKRKPKSYPKARNRWTTRPDLDNFVKMIDALNGVIWQDDSQIVEIRAEKAFADVPGFMFEIEEL